jgi:predicted ATP-grasp superfamily ATP-dependent carboligase
MTPDDCLLILGASTRAAALSAMRAGLRPSCADLFADTDAHHRWLVMRVAPSQYPHAFLELARQQPPGPWMYTGALENYPELIEKIASERPLWGNGREALALARSPFLVASLLERAGLPCPLVRAQLNETSRSARWLVKPLKSAGGSGIRFVSTSRHTGSEARPVYLQEYIPGEACSAVYVGTGSSASLLGVTQQLVGEPWLHAAPFHYCGSIGPLHLDSHRQDAFAKLGATVAKGCGLRGLFGIDCMLRDGVAWPVEINPRYTASVEVLERATGTSALSLHAKVFDPSVSSPANLPEPTSPVVGKAILFARKQLVFPGLDSCVPALSRSLDVYRAALWGDIPCRGEVIAAGKPMITLFERADCVQSCFDSLQRTTAALDRILFAP